SLLDFVALLPVHTFLRPERAQDAALEKLIRFLWVGRYSRPFFRGLFQGHGYDATFSIPGCDARLDAGADDSGQYSRFLERRLCAAAACGLARRHTHGFYLSL